mmetsp:Transcript_3071/g.12286  ORF Transcript_3071/g.12286 Transcript_3071/m.12286 type:complete len:204 (-) Transcript_3071:317-928(-)
MSRAAGQVASHPMSRHLKVLEHVLSYLVQTKDKGLVFDHSNHAGRFDLAALGDADFASEETSRRSRTGVWLGINGSPVYWVSRRQRMIAVLNSVPRGPGFRITYEIWGSPPVGEVLGRQADIDSSSTQTGTVRSSTWRLALNRSTPPCNGLHGSSRRASFFAIVAVTYLRMSLNLVSAIHDRKSGRDKVSYFESHSCSPVSAY